MMNKIPERIYIKYCIWYIKDWNSFQMAMRTL